MTDGEAEAGRTGRLRRPLVLGLVGLTAAACVPFAFYAMFSGFQEYDDEGYLLLSLRQYAAGGILYDRLFSQYGPAYYQVMAAGFFLLGLDFTHTTGRAAVLVVWLAVALMCAATTYRLTGNLAVTLGAELLVFQTLSSLRDEAPHPGGLLVLLLSGVVLAGTYVPGSRGRAALGLIALLLAAASLMKVNVGLLGLLATALVWLAAARLPRAGRLLFFATGALVVLAPVALMAPRAAVPEVRGLLVLGVSATLGVVLALGLAAPRGLLAARDLALFAGIVLATLAASCLREVSRGTTLAGLVRGVVLDPLALPGFNLYVLPAGPAALVVALAALALAALVVAAPRDWIARPGVRPAAAATRLLGGTFLWLAADGRLVANPLLAWPLLWLALIPEAAGAADRERAGRALLVAVAALQALHAFPVAGSQLAWATFLFVPVGALLLADGWRGLALAWAPVGRRWIAATAAVAMVAVAAAAVAATGATFRFVYRAGTPLGLPGAEAIRVAPEQAAVYRRLTRLVGSCRTFVTLPGLNSLYLFSRREPPTMWNTTSWMRLLTEAQQTEIVRRLADTGDPVCAIGHAEVALHWFDTPLVRYIRQEFTPVASIGQYRVLVRRASG
jgi:hypothetical protein